jgi:hypothetical protein
VTEQFLSPKEWLETIRRDYLRTYVSSGGSTVKVVVANETDRATIRDGLAAIAEAEGFQYAYVDSAQRRVHLVHQLFWEVATQIPWPHVARGVLRRALIEDDWTLPASNELSAAALAEANDQTTGELKKALRRVVSNRVYKDYALSREFRSAATALCRAVYDDSADLEREAADVVEWFRGTLGRIASVKRLGIFRKVSRSNARQLLYSTASWLRSAGAPGIVIVVDVARYVLGKDAPPTTFAAYTKLAALDLNEVLRQFIDATDELSGAVLVFLTDERFLTDGERGLGSYEALRLRLTDDVRDRYRPNPLAPMIHIGSRPDGHPPDVSKGQTT